MEMQIETRDDGTVRLYGYVNAVERDSRLLPKKMGKGAKRSYYERIRAGTFARAIEKGRNILLKFNHSRVVGDTASGSLKLEEDSIGLKAEAVTDDPEIRKAAEDGKLTGWSFGMVVGGQEWEDAGSADRRTVWDMELTEVSVLTRTPAYLGTSIEVRGFAQADTENYRRLVSVLKRKRKY